MKRRIIIIVVIVGVLGGLAGGTWLYLRRGSSQKMRSRVMLAIQADKFDKALDLAEKYITKYPKDWRGYYEKARACIGLGQYDEARSALGEAGRLSPAEVSVPILLADSYSLPAGRLMTSPKAFTDPAVLPQAIEQFNQANRILDKVKTSNQKRSLDVQQHVGLNYRRISLAWSGVAERLKKEAEQAEASRDYDLAATRRKESQAALVESNNAADQAIAIFLDVVVKDASRPVASQMLVELCIHREDEESLSAARKAIMALKSPPPIPAMTLALHEVTKQTDTTKRRERLEDLCRLLDDLSKKHPGEMQLKLTRADAALMLNDPEAADRLCGEILKADPSQAQARLIRAKVLMRQGKNAEAAGILFELMPKSMGNTRFAVDVHVAYALAAHALGEKDSAYEAMRKVVSEFDPDNAIARRYLAGSLLQEGKYQQAFTDAEAYYRAHPDDPAALRFFAETASRTDRLELAQKTLEKARADYGDRPEMMIAVGEGYLLVGDKGKAEEAIRRAAECKPADADARLAVARACRMVGRTSEAEKNLSDELAQNPNQPRFCFELGRLYVATGRVLQAVEQYQSAVRLDGHNVAYRLALAQTLFDIDDMEQCRSVLEQIDASNTDANLLRLRLGLHLGEPVSSDLALRQVRGAKQADRTVAMIYLNSGRPEQCVEICLSGLKKTPDDDQLRFLLGQAYLLQGQRDKCLEQWSEVLKAAPNQLPIYLRIGSVLAGRLGPPEVEKALLEIPGARRDMIDLAMGRLFADAGDFNASAKAYGRLIDSAETSEFSRNRARLLRARMLAAGGDVDQAVAELDKLSQIQIWRRAAIESKAIVLVAANRRTEASDLLSQLCMIAVEIKDTVALRRIAGLYMRMEMIEKALSVCDEAEKLFPKDADPFLLRAAVLSGAGRSSEAFPLLQKAIDLQPGNVRTYLVLARMLDTEHQPGRALEVLRRMEKQGQAGRTMSLNEQGLLFARWGLNAQALDCFQRIMSEEHADIPNIQLALGRVFAELGHKDRAKDLLKNISVYSHQYVQAQQLLAQIAETDDEQLAILDRLDEKVGSAHTGVLLQKMRVLLRANRPSEAVEAYRSYVVRRAEKQPMPAGAAYLAVRAMIAADDLLAASEFASLMSMDAPSPSWRQLAILLNLDDKSAAAKMLPDAEKADFYDAILGLILSVQNNDEASVRKWTHRIDQIKSQLTRMSGPVEIPSRYRLLVALSAGRVSQAETELANFKSAGVINRDAAAEIVSLARGDSKVAAVEATNLLKASVATDLGLAGLGKSWAMEVLKARPKCQWAAALVIKNQPDPATLKILLETIRPEDCIMARTIRASLLLNEGEYKKAAEVYRQASEMEKDNPYLVLAQAMATEKAGQFVEALSLYRKVWRATQYPVAGNNAAYLVAQLYPADTAQLGEALQWTDAAVKAAPQVVAFRDTKGWITFLLGRKEQALVEVRQAVKGLPRSPEVHYHMGVIETAAGNRDMGKWHLSAAVSSGDAIRANGKELTLAEARAVSLAKDALAGMNRNEK
ncbi:MAG: tetratricopeptide repeat protein [Planctomycetota bacterium]|nr:tetratricopeptide repeat protein [Planctomycetota bacterium]